MSNPQRFGMAGVRTRAGTALVAAALLSVLGVGAGYAAADAPAKGEKKDHCTDGRGDDHLSDDCTGEKDDDDDGDGDGGDGGTPDPAAVVEGLIGQLPPPPGELPPPPGELPPPPGELPPPPGELPDPAAVVEGLIGQLPPPGGTPDPAAVIEQVVGQLPPPPA